jgi:predicted unusual protein kinase regulating ubiquinone biosynthesis (AarF/ABC1/UbiB family)
MRQISERFAREESDWLASDMSENGTELRMSQVGWVVLVPPERGVLVRRTSRLRWARWAGGAVLLVAGVAGGLLRRPRLGRRREQDPWIPASRQERAGVLAGVGSRIGRLRLQAHARAVFASAAKREELRRELELRSAAEVAAALGAMKGMMMKLGQMASYMDESLPVAYREALASLQQDARPMSAELAAQVIRDELGARPEELFARWDPKPIAAASIGQVHRAITRDGRAVAVKIQYPGVAEAIAADLDNTDLLARLLRLLFPSLEPQTIVTELRARLAEELDYRVEAANQMLFADYYEGHPFISVPKVLAELSSARVLTSDLVQGERLDAAASWSQHQRNLAGEAIFRFVFRSLYRMGAFNGDPHPGNYLFRKGGRVAFLDFGLIRRFDAEEQKVFEEMIDTLVLRFDPAAFRRLAERSGLLKPDAPVSDQEVAEFFADFYALVLEDAPKKVTGEFASSMVHHVFDVSNPVTAWTDVPSAFVLLQRINLGLYGVLARLGAEANWRRIAEELWPGVDGPPSTPMGEAEAAWMARPRARTPARDTGSAVQ